MDGSLYKTSRFGETLGRHGLQIKRECITTLQINIGKRCNQACHHCHVESGPNRTENMERKTVDRILELLQDEPKITLIDITGGAPEMNPHFRDFVKALRAMSKDVIDRCNLTVLFEKGQEDTAEFLAEQRIQVVASLPCYLEDNVNAQRGKGVFGKSITALEKLNALGYGKPDSGLVLNLVYNPIGTHLPPEQKKLEAAYREHLQKHFGIVFNNLFTITNMPIKRFAHMLERDGLAEQYMQLLIDSFNVQAVQEVMCKQLVSISWDGKLYDCDFNQMLEIPLNFKPRTIWDISSFSTLDQDIAFADHCFGCTAGAGSSCTGALLKEGKKA
ncbi:MAG: radical SAM protein [Alphaproteobacteria bacterium CG1_02_46_17]|nr:MAG: radical SAM protein [Alphaproteobacteria bacterium CG1_02_46_17]